MFYHKNNRFQKNETDFQKFNFSNSISENRVFNSNFYVHYFCHHWRSIHYGYFVREHWLSGRITDCLVKDRWLSGKGSLVKNHWLSGKGSGYSGKGSPLIR